MGDTFSEWESEAVGFTSKWKETREVSTTFVQTDEIQHEERGLQTSACKPISTQTDSDSELVAAPLRFDKEAYPPSLFAFFAKVTDQVCKCLEDNQDPFALEVFKENGEGDAGVFSKESEAEKQYTLRNTSVPPEEFGGSCIAWNTAGSQIAVGYRAFTHESWCCHRVPVSAWNLNRSHNFSEDNPHSQIFLPSCTTCMEFHPVNPSVIAVGLHSGQVALVDFASKSMMGDGDRDETENDNAGGGSPRRTRSKEELGDLGYFLEGSGHSVSVTAVQWIRLNRDQLPGLVRSNKGPSSPYFLITAGRDGFICLWSTNNSNTKLVLEKKFIVWADMIPEEVQIGNRNCLGMKELGILGLSCCKDDPFTFIFVTFGGHIFQGSIHGTIEAYTAMAELSHSDSLEKETLYDPQVVPLGRIDGNPCSVDCSPYHRNIFISAMNSGQVIIHNVLEPSTHVAEFSLELGACDTLNDAKWSGRPTMFAVAFEKKIRIFDLKLGNVSALTLPHDEVVKQLAFNKTILGKLAVCDANGAVHIWNLPSSLSSHEPDELDILINYSSKSTTL